jgi:hypothetical protein
MKSCEICGVTLRKGEVKYCLAHAHAIEMEKEWRDRNLILTDGESAA